jgi:uncharacterized membrane protein YeaQ/YmgE (transglycosylase-associated protein family)
MAMINSLIAEIGKKFVLGAKSSAFIAEAVRAMLIGAGVPAEILNGSNNEFVSGRHLGETSMSVIAWIILGLIAGYIGSRIVDKEGKGLWLNMALGIVGAIVGGVIFGAFGGTGVTGVNLYSLIVAVIGSIVVLWVYNAFISRRRM